MWSVLTSEAEVLVAAGFLYAPLLFDPDIAREVASRPPPAPTSARGNGPAGHADNLVHTESGYFVKTLSLSSLVEHYPVVFPEDYDAARQRLQRQVLPPGFQFQPVLAPRLATLIFAVLPHFLRLPGRGGHRRDAAAILAYLAARVPPPAAAQAYLDRLREQEAGRREVLRRLDQMQTRPQPQPEGRQPGRHLAPWFQDALRQRLIAQEKASWSRKLGELQDLARLPARELALLLAIAAAGTLEVDGVGFCPDDRRPGEYLVYKRTGEFVLQDYFHRLYLFPDCRVGVSTAGPFHPAVLDLYKHPFLRRFGTRQLICLTDYQPAQVFSAPAVIRALEEGLNALYYGYNSRKRNGYNSLDRYGRHQSEVDFADWRLSDQDPRLASGDLEIKNNSW